jgi:hypothetical protein
MFFEALGKINRLFFGWVSNYKNSNFYQPVYPRTVFSGGSQKITPSQGYSVSHIACGTFFAFALYRGGETRFIESLQEDNLCSTLI